MERQSLARAHRARSFAAMRAASSAIFCALCAPGRGAVDERAPRAARGFCAAARRGEGDFGVRRPRRRRRVDSAVDQLVGARVRKLSRLNQLLAALPSDAWLIFSDVDELMSRRSGAAPADAMCGARRPPAVDSAGDRPHTDRRRALCPKESLRGYKPKPIHANPLKITLIKARINGHAPAYLNGAVRRRLGGTPPTNNHCQQRPLLAPASARGTRRIADKAATSTQSTRLTGNADAASSLRCLAPRWRRKLAGDRDVGVLLVAPAESPPGPPPAVVRLPAERPIAEKSSRCTLGECGVLE